MSQKFHPDKVHQRHALLFLFHSDLSAAEAHRRLQQAYGADALSYETCRRRFDRFQQGNYTIDDEVRSGRPMEMDVDVLKDLVESDPHLTTRDMSAQLGFTHSTIEAGLRKLGKVQKLGRWVPHELTQNDRDRRIDCCYNLLSLKRTFNWLRDLITGDEKWIQFSNVTRRPQWIGKDEQPATIPKPDPHGKKVMVSVWWSARGVEYWEPLPHGRTINAKVYTDQLRKLKARVDSTRKNDCRISFLQDNARPHVAKSVKAELATFGWRIIPHPPYSPDLAPTDYWLFSHLQRFLDGQHFTNDGDVKSALDGFFSSQPPSFYEEGIMKLPERWRKVVDTDGAYI